MTQLSFAVAPAGFSFRNIVQAFFTKLFSCTPASALAVASLLLHAISRLARKSAGTIRGAGGPVVARYKWSPGPCNDSDLVLPMQLSIALSVHCVKLQAGDIESTPTISRLRTQGKTPPTFIATLQCSPDQVVISYIML